MKDIIRSLVAAGLVLTAGGCSQDQISTKYNPAGDSADKAFFLQKGIMQEFPVSATGEQVLSVAIYRQNASGELAVTLQPTIPEDAASLFEIPTSVGFANGEYSATIPVKVKKVEDLVKGKTYELSIAIAGSEDATAPYKKFAKTTITAALALSWEPVFILSDPTKLLSDNLTDADFVKDASGKKIKQTATYTYQGVWEGEDDKVELEHVAGTNLFRMTKWGDGSNNVIFEIDPEEKITVGSEQYAVVHIMQQKVTKHDTYGDVFIADVPTVKEGATFETYPCYWNGKRDFHFEVSYFCAQGPFNDPDEHKAETLSLHDGSSSVTD